MALGTGNKIWRKAGYPTFSQFVLERWAILRFSGCGLFYLSKFPSRWYNRILLALVVLPSLRYVPFEVFDALFSPATTNQKTEATWHGSTSSSMFRDAKYT